MMGPDIVNDEACGIIPRACQYIFNHVAKNPEHVEFKVTCSFLEIYKEVIKDLLNPKGVNLKVRETPTRGVWVEGLTETEVDSHLRVLQLLHQGEEHRAVASTNMNSVSSRSHSLFILSVTQKMRDGATKIGKLNLADLAGSEKVGKTGASGETLEEAKKINQSLSALGNCIMALTKLKKSHVPYRDSKLTFVLRESLGGNTKTTLLIACSPHSFNMEETVSTLRFGQRAKAIKNKVKINAQRSVAELEIIVKKLTKEVKVLKKYANRLEIELGKLKVEGLDLEAIKRSIYEETAQGSLKLQDTASSDTPNKDSKTSESGADDANSDDGGSPRKNGSTKSPSKTDEEDDTGDQGSTASSPRSGSSGPNIFTRALTPTLTSTPSGTLLRTPTSAGSPMTRSATTANLKTPKRHSSYLHGSRDDMEAPNTPSSTNTTPTRPSIYLDGILAEDADGDAFLDAQLEYNRMKENLNLQIQDLNEDLAQAKEERESLEQQHRLQLAKANEENAALKAEIDALKAQLNPRPHAGDLASSSAGPSSGKTRHRAVSESASTDGVPRIEVHSSSRSSPTPSMRRSRESPRGPIVIPLDGSSPLRREASDPVFMTRQMFHWMVLATKLEMFSQGHSLRYDVDFENMFRDLIESNVSTQVWPKKIMKALEAPSE